MDLKKRICKLSELSSDITLHIEKMTDNPEVLDEVVNEYQELFSDTIRKYGFPNTNSEAEYETDFTYGGHVVFASGTEYPANIQVSGSEIIHIAIPKKLNDQDFYLYSQSVKYDMTKNRDRDRLKKRGVVKVKYSTPTETEL